MRCLRALEKAGAWAEERLNRLDRQTWMRGVIFFAILALIGGTMFLLNVHTPLNVDDYDFMYSWATGEKLSGVGDVLASQKVFYQSWGGRSINHTNLQLMMYLGKDVYNVVNTLMYLLLLLEVYWIARPREGRFHWELLMLVHLPLFTMVPFFGMICLWASGACNYLWGTAIALTPLLVLRSVRENGWFSRGRIMGALCVPIGFAAGWTNENTACGMIALVFIALALDWMNQKRQVKRLWSMWLAQCAGALVMLLAPGNGIRSATLETGSLLVELLRRAAAVTVYGASYVGVLFAAVLLLAAASRGKGARIGYAMLLVFGALMVSYAMVGSPVLSDRTFTGAIVLVLAALCVLAGDWLVSHAHVGWAKMIILPALMVFMVYTGYHALKDVKAYESEYAAVVETIETAAARGDSRVTVPCVLSHSRFTVDALIGEDPEQWPNTTMERVFGIEIVAEPAK